MVVGRLLVLNKHLGGWVKEIETGKFGYWGYRPTITILYPYNVVGGFNPSEKY